MILRIIDNDFHFECENLCRIFYPNEKITVMRNYDGEDEKTVCVKCTEKDEKVEITVECKIGEKLKSLSDSVNGNLDSARNECELTCARLIYLILTEITGYEPPWGLLTGVRPSKLFLNLTDEMGKEKAEAYFLNNLLVSPEKTKLAVTVAENEKRIISLSKPDSFSLYISIPFCPSRCSYCSFVSHSIGNPNAKKILPEYLERLKEEIRYTGSLADEIGLKLETVYIGGGTPGVLEAEQTDELISEIENSFNLSNIREFTVEMGRPDTVTAEKLEVLQKHNVGRISINPQTFNQKTLDIIGRKHSAEQTADAFELSKNYSFNCINMDLIAGLPGENLDDYIKSVDCAISLSPENITVHSLALKRSSNLNTQGSQVQDGIEAKKMVDYSTRKLLEAGYIPYYMYRQSKCVGNLENVGWCKEGTNGYYNVYMMEETHTVLACGAGAVTKLCVPKSTKVERIFNYKYPFEYNSGFDEIIKRKEVIKEFYNKYNIIR